MIILDDNLFEKVKKMQSFAMDCLIFELGLTKHTK